MDMHIFIRQNFGKGVALKNFISWRFESRFHCNLTEISRTTEFLRKVPKPIHHFKAYKMKKTYKIIISAIEEEMVSL